VAFENAAAVASGVEAGLKVMMRKGRIPKKYIKVVGMGGDGGTSDIGLQALSGALERGLLVNAVRPDAVRLAPPLLVRDEELDRALEVLADVLGALFVGGAEE